MEALRIRDSREIVLRFRIVGQLRLPIGSYAPPDFKGAIGVNNDSVEGTDITIPVYNFKETHYIPVALVTPAYKAALFYLTGKVNAAPFKGFAPDEVLF